MSLTRQEKLEAKRMQEQREAEFQQRLQEALDAPDAAEAEVIEQSSSLTPEQAARAEYEPKFDEGAVVFIGLQHKNAAGGTSSEHIVEVQRNAQYFEQTYNGLLGYYPIDSDIG